MAGETQKLTLLDIELGARARTFELILAEMEVAEREARAEEVIGALNATCLSFAQERVFATVVDPLLSRARLRLKCLTVAMKWM